MELSDEYKTIEGGVAEGFYSEKRSKFYSFAFHVETEDDVKSIVQEYRKKFYDARHVCYAYVLGYNGETFRTNDDGEPSSTAGKPIHGQIVKNELTNVLVIVVRYFGGVKLGTSGLLVAYKTAAADAIGNAEVVKCQVEELVTFDFPYVMMNDVMRVVKEMKPRVVEQKFENTCHIVLSIRRSEAAQLKSRLDNLAFA